MKPHEFFRFAENSAGLARPTCPSLLTIRFANRLILSNILAYNPSVPASLLLSLPLLSREKSDRIPTSQILLDFWR